MSPSAARGRALLVVAGFAGIVLASFAVPAALAYDPWAWLVWGREVVHLDLRTVGGPSWKPLPVLATTGLALLGDDAPTLWLVVARTGALLALVGVYRVAARLAGRGAGLVAAGLLVLTPDGGPRFVRLFFEGHSAPLTAALAVWAVDRHLAGRRRSALLLGGALALARPEAWPFLALYAGWLWREDARARTLVAGGLVLVPLLWFGGDWWGSGSPWHGADAAQVIAHDADRAADAVLRAMDVVVAPVWLAAAVAVIHARRRDRVVPLLATGAVTWSVVVIVMSAVFGYAGLSRFFLPSAALLCILAGAGLARLVGSLPSGRSRLALVTAVAAVALPFVALRARGVDDQVREVEARAGLVEQLDRAIARAGGADRVLRCGRVAVDAGGVPRLALAWELGITLEAARWQIGPRPGVVLVRDRRDPSRVLAGARAVPELRFLAASDPWLVYSVDCPALSGAPTPRSELTEGALTQRIPPRW